MYISASLFKKLILAVSFALFANIKVEAKEWRGMVPLKSSRADVEQLLGSPSINRADWAVYQMENEKVSIEYSKGPCTVEFSPWNVPKHIVISIWVTPISRVLFADLRIDQTRLKKVPDYH